MRTLLALVFVALIAQDSKPERNTWSGFKSGSWIVLETAETSDGKSAKERHRFKMEVQPGGEVVCHVSKEEDKPAIFFEERTIQPGYGVEEGSTKAEHWKAETLEISGRKFDCKSQAYHSKEANAIGKQGATVWTTKDIKVPYREWDPAELTVTPGRIVHSGGQGLALDPNVLRYSMSTHPGDRSGRVELHRFSIVELDHKLKVAGLEIACVVEEGMIEEKDPKGATKVTLKRWLSDAVPGRVVRSEMRGEVRGVKVERIRQVVSFKVAE